ncbi:TetR/AcrR family transcriptional regulator [Cohnella rhizosphaerae]|uniref:TetR/AcrR family transcriptional regulator n=1 Tax=Cohnella rhizosphaerae TaxID=1457232 RepID=A0A9X4KU74_9BACL|nr:TetR/AcrR family transcriptional regulator C-terminal domain-containing protein [Cohnella rhizosphaerae]MDG0810346.1 TetR/AcrR family transcriptional regulator [Cohnella rhizosphaerae]
MSKVDRRTIKTREAIYQALIELMSEKDFDTITVNDISNRANIHRGTVYLHYSDKYDLLDRAIKDHLSNMLKFCVLSRLPDEELDFDQSLLSMFLYFEEHFSFYFTVITNKGISCFKEQFIQIIKNGIMERLKVSRNYEEGNKEVAVQFMLSAYVGVVEWWIKNKMPLSPQNVAEQLWDMLEMYYAQ